IRVHRRRTEDGTGADGGTRRGAGRVDGERHAARGAFAAAAVVVLLLPPDVRAGDQSCDRSDSRAAGDVAGNEPRPARESARGIGGAFETASYFPARSRRTGDARTAER